MTNCMVTNTKRVYARNAKIPYANRKKFCRKIRDTEREAHRLEQEGDWWGASRLRHQLYNCWWGYKRYSEK